MSRLHALGLLVILVASVLPAWADSRVQQATESHAESYHVRYQDMGLAMLAEDLGRKSGVAISVPLVLATDRVSRDVRAKTWAEVVKEIFRDYDYVTIAGDHGQLLSLIVHARVRGNAAPMAEAGAVHPGPEPGQESAVQGLPSRGHLPRRFQGLNPDSVTPIAIPFEQLSRMKRGESVSLALGGMEYRISHDRQWPHGHGETSWVGYLNQAGKQYRAILTYGTEGAIVGSIATPKGAFRIEQAEGSTWVVNVAASGLRAGDLTGDHHSSDAMRADEAAVLGFASASEARPSTVDLMVLYAPGVNEDQPGIRIKHLVALTQQAFVDSDVFVRLRLVHTEELGDQVQRSNLEALDDLTRNRVATDVVALRVRHGADLVAWLHPFQAARSKNCGVAWVAGSNHRPVSADAGFVVVADGYDGGYVCHDYTFAHELGHAFGNVHDQGISSFPGIFAFSYAWAVPGRFATIMSYLFDVAPVVGRFANPKLACTRDGLPCGKADTADNARTINLTAPAVASFMDQRHP